MLIKYTEAEYYIMKALENDPLNMYMLRHFKKIKTNQNDYLGAIKVQQRIVSLKPEEEADLVLLYIKSGEIEKATQLLKKLDDLNKLPKGLEALKESLLQEYSDSEEPGPDQRVEELPKTKVDQLREAYSLNKDYDNLKVLLEKEWKSDQYLDLLKDSEEGLATFPAQPFLYLMNGRAYNSLRKHKDAELVLLEGLDYVIDDDKLKASFFKELSLSYKAMGQNKLATDFDRQAQKLMGE